MLHGVQLISKPNISQNGLIYLARLQIDFNRNLNAFKLGLMVQKFVQIGAKVRAALQQ